MLIIRAAVRRTRLLLVRPNIMVFLLSRLVVGTLFVAAAPPTQTASAAAKKLVERVECHVLQMYLWPT